MVQGRNASWYKESTDTFVIGWEFFYKFKSCEEDGEFFVCWYSLSMCNITGTCVVHRGKIYKKYQVS